MAGVIAIDPATDPRWDRYVEAHPRALVYHLGAWSRILARAYRWRPSSLALERPDGSLAGVMPVLRKRRPLTGARHSSQPGIRLGGPLGDGPDEEAALMAAARDAARADGSALTVECRTPGLEQRVPGLWRRAQPPTWIVALPDDPDDLLERWRRGSKNLHRSLRKARNAPLTVREGTTEADLRAAYALYLETMRKHGAPPRSYRQLALARAELGPRFRLFLVEHEGRPVAAGVYHVFGGTMELLYNASDEAALPMRPNHLLYWHTISWAIAAGLERYDFGFALPNHPLGQFKAQWGAEAVSEWRYDGVADEETGADETLPQPGVSTDAGPADRLRPVWVRAPAPVTRAVATAIFRYA